MPCFTIKLQRIGQSLRKGGPTEMQLKRFEETLFIYLHDTTSGLTYAALSGIVQHRMTQYVVNKYLQVFKNNQQKMQRGCLVVEWMDKKGYDLEGKHLSVIQNWRRALDEGGLHSGLQSQFNRKSTGVYNG